MGVRRHLKSQNGSISLLGLLEDLKDNCICEAGNLFQAIGKEEIEKDILELKNISEKIEEFADKRIAHLDKRELDVLPTFGDLHDCMDKMKDLVKKYLLKINGVGYIDIEPAMQYDFEEIFTKPWKKITEEKE